MSSWSWFCLSLFGGGFAFWISDVIIPALDRNEQRVAVTIACPVILALFCLFILRLRKADPSGPSTAIFALIGVWVMAPWFTMLAQTVRGSGFRAGFEPKELFDLLFSSVLPTEIFEMATLEGTALALSLGTAAMIAFYLTLERSRWIVPPSVWAALKRRS